MNQNKTVVDLNKVAYAKFYYETHALGRTYQRHNKPKEPTVNGHEFDCDEVRPGIIAHFNENDFISSQKSETMLEYATRRRILDVWTPTLTLQLSNSHSLTYTGDKAISIWKEWNKRIFKRKE